MSGEDKNTTPVEMTLGEQMDLLEVLLNGVMRNFVCIGFTEGGEAINLTKADTPLDQQALITAIDFAAENKLEFLQLAHWQFYAESTEVPEEELVEEEEISWDDNSDEEPDY